MPEVWISACILAATAVACCCSLSEIHAREVGDSIWQAADARARGFLIGATYGRTTLNGEGLQHQDSCGGILHVDCYTEPSFNGKSTPCPAWQGRTLASHRAHLPGSFA